MKKEGIRKEFFHLRIKGHSYFHCKKLLKILFQYEVSTRSLKRWEKLHKETEWNFKDKSTRPKIIHKKITNTDEEKIILLRKKTGFGEYKLSNYVKIGHTSIYKILYKNNLTNMQENRKKKIKYVRWQREHPNSLWQIDHTDEQNENNYTLSVLDDCSRYSLILATLNRATTEAVIEILKRLFTIHGKPREILTDNGGCFGLKSEDSKFDKFLKRNGIKHIRTAIHSPTTTGKVERLFQTMDKEMKFCNNDLEFFRMRYNHFRPHSSLCGKTPAEIYFSFSKLFKW